MNGLHKMHTVQYKAYSAEFKELEFNLVNKPVPKADQVLVKVFVAAANPVDLYLYYGILKSNRWKMNFPFTPGYDFSGVIEEVGSRVSNFSVGDEVWGVNWGNGRHDSVDDDPDDPIGGSFSEYMVINANKVSLKPRLIPFGCAAALGTSGTAAYQCIHDIGLVGKGCKVLILGGSTMVGCISIQLAKYYGAWVATTCSTRSVEFTNQFGPDLVIPYDNNLEKWYRHPQVKALDFVLDVAGVPRTVEMLKEGDGMINVGAAFVSLVNPEVGSDAKAHPPFSHARFYCFHQSSQDQNILMDLVEREVIKVPIADHFPFTKKGVEHLFEGLQSRRAQGKLLLRLD